VHSTLAALARTETCEDLRKRDTRFSLIALVRHAQFRFDVFRTKMAA
jgi:hypothetical protein